MKANNITICVPSKGCTRNCPYCISKMTPNVIGVHKFSTERIMRAIAFAQTMGATSLLITSRGEPLLNIRDIRRVITIAKEKFIPSEIQTNGDIDKYVDELAKNGLCVYAVSIDSIKQTEIQKRLYERVNHCSMILRWTVILHDENMKLDVKNWLDLAQAHGVRQLSFRKLSVPLNPRDERPAKWIAQHSKNFPQWMKGLEAYIENRKIIRKLVFGPTVIEAESISLTYFPYCIQESGNEEELRSLILREDGHIYTDWNSNASILF